MRYSTGVKPATEARRRELLDWLREAPGKLGHWAVVADGDAVGWASLTPLPGTDRIQLAYRLQRRAWGRGCPPQPAASCATMPGACWMSRPCPPSPGRTTCLAARARKLGFVQAGTETHYGRDTVAYLLPRPASA